MVERTSSRVLYLKFRHEARVVSLAEDSQFGRVVTGCVVLQTARMILGPLKGEKSGFRLAKIRGKELSRCGDRLQ